MGTFLGHYHLRLGPSIGSQLAESMLDRGWRSNGGKVSVLKTQRKEAPESILDLLHLQFPHFSRVLTTWDRHRKFIQGCINTPSTTTSSEMPSPVPRHWVSGLNTWASFHNNRPCSLGVSPVLASILRALQELSPISLTNHSIPITQVRKWGGQRS